MCRVRGRLRSRWGGEVWVVSGDYKGTSRRPVGGRSRAGARCDKVHLRTAPWRPRRSNSSPDEATNIIPRPRRSTSCGPRLRPGARPPFWGLRIGQRAAGCRDARIRSSARSSPMARWRRRNVGAARGRGSSCRRTLRGVTPDLRPQAARGAMVLCPASGLGSAWMRRFGRSPPVRSGGCGWRGRGAGGAPPIAAFGSRILPMGNGSQCSPSPPPAVGPRLCHHMVYTPVREWAEHAEATNAGTETDSGGGMPTQDLPGIHGRQRHDPH